MRATSERAAAAPGTAPPGSESELARQSSAGEPLPERTRRILIHINNTHPILDEDSAERALLAERGVEVAHDGLEVRL